MSPFKNKHFKKMFSYFILAASVIIAYKFIMGIDTFLYYVQGFFGVISPFIWGMLIAYILNIPCNGIQRMCMKKQQGFLYRKRKLLSIIFVYLCAIVLILLISRVVIPTVYRSGRIFVSNFSEYYLRAQQFIEDINDLDILSFDISIDKFMYAMRDFIINKLPGSMNTIFNLSAGILNAFLALITSIYFLFEKENILKNVSRILHLILKEPSGQFFFKYVKILNNNFKQYIYAQTLDGFILGTIATIELLFLKSPYALMLGLMLGIVNYVPYFGSIFGSLVAVITVAFTQNMKTAIICAIILLVTQQIDANVIQPRLMSESFALSPLLIIISISIGGAISGIFGMIAAIPLVAVIKEILGEIITYYEQKKII